MIELRQPPDNPFHGEYPTTEPLAPTWPTWETVTHLAASTAAGAVFLFGIYEAVELLGALFGPK